MNTAPAKTRWYDKDLREDFLRPALTALGGPKGAALAAAAGSGLPYYLFARLAGLEAPGWRTAAFAPLTGLVAYAGAGGRFTPGGYKDPDTETWVNRMMGAPWRSKTASDGLSRHTLFEAVGDLPGHGIAQKNFLALGIAASPGGDTLGLPALAQGFGGVANAVAGGALPAVVRAAEGALIGGAFGHLLGVPPKGRKWMAGVGAVADALYGNRLVNAVGILAPRL